MNTTEYGPWKQCILDTGLRKNYALVAQCTPVTTGHHRLYWQHVASMVAQRKTFAYKPGEGPFETEQPQENFFAKSFAALSSFTSKAYQHDSKLSVCSTKIETYNRIELFRNKNSDEIATHLKTQACLGEWNAASETFHRTCSKNRRNELNSSPNSLYRFRVIIVLQCDRRPQTEYGE